MPSAFRWPNLVALTPVLIGLAVGCSRPTPPTISPERVTLTRIDAQGIGLRVELTAVNPNSRDLAVREVSSRLLVDKTHDVGHVTVPGELVLPAGKATKIDVPMSIAWSEIGVLAQLAAGADAVPYSVDGTLAMAEPLGQLGLPFHLEGTIPHDQIVNAAINSLPWVTH